MVGVIGGQTVRLSVTSPPNPVRVSLGFVRSDGQPIILIGDFPGPTKSFTLQPGESVSLDLAANYVLADGETRAEIRPVVRPDDPPSRIIPTLEVIDDTTRKTAVLYAPVTRVCGSN
jgi:hypothetical protein